MLSSYEWEAEHFICDFVDCLCVSAKTRTGQDRGTGTAALQLRCPATFRPIFAATTSHGDAGDCNERCGGNAGGQSGPLARSRGGRGGAGPLPIGAWHACVRACKRIVRLITRFVGNYCYNPNEKTATTISRRADGPGERGNRWGWELGVGGWGRGS